MKKTNKRGYLDILYMKQMEDKSICQFLEQLIRIVCNLGKWKFGVLLSLTAIRLSAEKGINKYLPPILTHCGMLMRQQGKFDEAFEIAYTGGKMLNEIPECRGVVWIRGQAIVQGGVLHLHRAFKHSLEPYREIHRQGVPCNQVEWAAIGAMLYVWCFLASSQPITALFEPKLILYEEEARRLGQPGSMCVTFSTFRKTILNLQGRGRRHKNPAVLSGVAIDEEKALLQFDKNSKIYEQTQRDFGICRLLLAIVYNYVAKIEKMVLRLEPFPDFGMPIVRQHLRFALQGLGAFILCQHFKSLSAGTASSLHLPTTTAAAATSTTSGGGGSGSTSSGLSTTLSLSISKRGTKLSNGKDKHKHYLAMGLKIMKQFKKSAFNMTGGIRNSIGIQNNNNKSGGGGRASSSRGSENALPVYFCLVAEHKPSKKNYNAAIRECLDGDLLHLAAIMNERCGTHQFQRDKKDHGKEYITKANKLYADCGAVGKTKQLVEWYIDS